MKEKMQKENEVEAKRILQAESMLIEKPRLAIRERFLKIRRELRCAGRMFEKITVPKLGRSATAAPHAYVSQPTLTQRNSLADKAR